MNNATRSIFHGTIHLNDVFGYAERQINGTYSLVYKIKLKGSLINFVLKRESETKAKVDMKVIRQCIPRYAPKATGDLK